MRATFLFYDYETFGANPSLDRPAQFAAIRSDADFNIIGKPEVYYCKPADDYLPQPEAILITGITPQEAYKKGMNEAEFSRRIYNLFMVPNTCIVGYNNIRFDDEVTRNIFYRNFYDPYSWSWRNGNSRWDLLNGIWACYALCPEGMVWPKNDTGLPTFRLEYLTRANGIKHINRHNALADVYATIAIAKLIKKNHPRLFNYLLHYRYKQNLLSLIDILKMQPLVYISSVFGARRGNISWIVPLAWHPNNKNALIAVDLAGDITSLLSMNINDMREQLYTKSKVSENNSSPVPIKIVCINKCPVLARAKVLRPQNANRLKIDREFCLDNLKLLRNNHDIREKIVTIFSEDKSFGVSENVDTQLYNRFFNNSDRTFMNIVLKTKPCNLSSLSTDFVDSRIKKLLFNYRARNYPDTLNKTEKMLWQRHCQKTFTLEFLESYNKKLQQLFVEYRDNSEKQNLLKLVCQYVHKIIEKHNY